jgi:hypothetical protein
MALTNTMPPFKKSSMIGVGEKICGFVTGFFQGGQYPEIRNLKMRTEGGEEFILSVSGNLKYFEKNGCRAGYYYEFIRMEDKKNSRGQTVRQFKVLVDKDKKCEVETDEVPQMTQPTADKSTMDEIDF